MYYRRDKTRVNIYQIYLDQYVEANSTILDLHNKEAHRHIQENNNGHKDHTFKNPVASVL